MWPRCGVACGCLVEPRAARPGCGGARCCP
uniref:Uncharacterized protein n=1 Tax=Arundo donax TaxID=35708 RepID=A0A0A9HR65_ARUDO